MRLRKKVFEDYIGWQTYKTRNPQMIKAIKQMLPAGEDNLEPHISVMSQEKLIIAAQKPEQIREIILVRIGGRGCPEKIYRSRLTLKRKQRAGKI